MDPWVRLITVRTAMTDPISTLLAAIPRLAKVGADIATASDEAKRNAQLITDLTLQWKGIATSYAKAAPSHPRYASRHD